MPSAHRPSIRYCQNFLVDSNLVDRLLDTSSIGPDDLVYEIGPGTGVITQRLARRCRQVIAVEKDVALARRLQRRFARDPHVEIRVGDCMNAPLPAAEFKVFANIPFNLTAAIVTRLTRAALPPNDQYLVVQREAAERFAGRPTTTTLYALLLAPWFDVRICYCFRRTDFAPQPSVEVVLLRIAKRGPPLVPRAQAQLYRDFVASAFTAMAALCRRGAYPYRWIQVDAAGLRRVRPLVCREAERDFHRDVAPPVPHLPRQRR